MGSLSEAPSSLGISRTPRRTGLLGVALSIGLMTLLGACSRSHDAWFANPCDQALTVRTFYVERGTSGMEKSDDQIAEATLRPSGITKVEDAFQDANGFVWFVEVVGGPTLRMTKADMPKWLVSLPATACSSS